MSRPLPPDMCVYPRWTGAAKPADAPAQIAAEPPAEPAGTTGRPDTAETRTADHRSSQAMPGEAGTAEVAPELHKPAAPMFLPYAPEERVRVARIRMHPDLIATLPAWHGLRADPGPGLLGVPVIADDTLPPGGWRSYDRDGCLLGQHPPADDFHVHITARPRPAPRPPWWRIALDRARALTRKD